MKPPTKTRNSAGEMVPLGTLVEVVQTTGPDKVVRYNMYPAADINGVALPGLSSSEAIALAQQLAAKELPQGMSYEWTDLTFQEILAGNTIVFIFPLCVLLVFLTLAAQYESWSLPFAIILIVPMCLLTDDNHQILGGIAMFFSSLPLLPGMSWSGRPL